MEQLKCYDEPMKYSSCCILHAHVNVTSCHSEFPVHKVMNDVANPKIHLSKGCT